MPFTKFTNLDFDQIKTSIKDYLRANSDFSDFDFEGSNFSVLIDALAYNTYITAFNSNMIVNESFLDSATLRENVVSLARNIGYLPRSRSASKAQISFDVTGLSSDLDKLTLKKGLVCVGNVNDTQYTFSIPDNISTTVSNSTAKFENIDIYQGTLLTKEFTVDGSIDQKFVLNNPYIDTNTIIVYVDGIQYFLADNIFNVTSSSLIFFLSEIQDERYELFFGDGLIGKKLENGATIKISYIVTDGPEGNGASGFSFSGTLLSDTNPETLQSPGSVNIITNQSSQNGGNIESIDSIKYYAPKIYSSQYRAVTARDYESIVKMVYPDAETVSVIGGEELDPPEFGTVTISIKPKNGTYVSDFSKERILSQLKQYSISGINQKIVDLKVLYVEIDSSVYYNYSQVSSLEKLKSSVVNTLTTYSKSSDLNKFGGRFKYSKVLQIIDNTDTSITSNITRVKIRRDLKAALNQSAQYELCFGNKFHVNSDGFNIKSTGFKIYGESNTVYFTDTPNPNKKSGIISIVRPIDDVTTQVVVESAGTINYEKGEIIINTIDIVSTSVPNGIIEVQAFPESNDIVGLRDLYINFSISKSTINMVRDVIASGDEITGTSFVKDFYTSSYSNGKLIRD